MTTRQPAEARIERKCVSLDGRNPGPRGGPPAAALSAKPEGGTMLLAKPVISEMPGSGAQQERGKHHCREDAS